MLILPTLNEEAGLARTLEEWERVASSYPSPSPDVLVIDGQSTDGTLAVASAHGVHVLRQTGSGKGAAIREALAWAHDRGFTSVGVIDADATYPCERLPALFQLLEQGCDVVIGVRRPERPPHTSARDLVHRVGNALLNLCAAELSGGPLLDVCSGFWGLRTDIVPSLALESDGFEVESELFVKAFRRGLRVVQIPIGYRPRVGEAKLRALHDGSRIFRSIVRHSLGTRTVGGNRTGPGPRSSTEPPADRVALGELHAVVHALNPANLVFLTSRASVGQVDAVARELAAHGLGMRVETRSVRKHASGVPSGKSSPADARDLPGSLSPTLILLPNGVGDGTGPSSLLVEVPRSRRVVCLRPANAQPAVPIVALNGGGPAFFARSYNAPPGVWTILGAVIDASGVGRELAILRANSPGVRVDVFRQGRRPLSGVVAVPPFTVDPSLRVGRQG